MAGIETPTLAERIAKVEQRQDDQEKAADAEFARWRFWAKVYLGITCSAIGSVALAAVGWAWHLGYLSK